MNLFAVYPQERKGAEALSIDVSDSPFGVPVSKAPPSLERSFKKQTEEEGFSFASYEYANDERDMRYNIEVLSDGKNLYNDDDEELFIAEEDNRKKANAQRGHRGVWYIPETPLGAKNEKVFPDELMSAIEKWFYSGTTVPVTMSLSVTRHTNGGYPTFESGASPYSDLNLVISQIVAANNQLTFEARKEIIEDAMAGIGYNIPCCFTLFSRTRNSSKFFRDWTLTEKGASSASESRGFACPMRMVQGGPSFMNSEGRPAAIMLKERMYAKPPFHVYTEAAQLREFRQYHLMGMKGNSEDISGYDLSVSAGMIRQAGESYKRILSQRKFIDQYNAHISMPLLGPPMDSVNEAFLYSKEGMITSGFITTDIDGSYINFCRVVYSMAAATGWSYETTLNNLGVKWFCKIKGDDTVLFEPKTGYEREVYLAATRDLGFKTDILPGVFFLMTRYNLENNLYYGLLSRSTMQTFLREHEPAGKYTEIFGLYARASRVIRHPTFHRFEQAIIDHPSSSELFGAWGTPSSFYDIERIVYNPGFIEGFQNEIAKGKGRVWLRNFISGITRGTMDLGEAYTDMRVAGLLGFKNVRQLQYFPKEIKLSTAQLKKLIKQWLQFFYTDQYNSTGGRLPREEVLQNSQALRSLLVDFRLRDILDEELNIKTDVT